MAKKEIDRKVVQVSFNSKELNTIFVKIDEIYGGVSDSVKIKRALEDAIDYHQVKEKLREWGFHLEEFVRRLR